MSTPRGQQARSLYMGGRNSEMRRSFPAFSRSGATGPLGKCDERLDIAMSSELKTSITALALLRGGPKKTPSEYAREILEQHVFGVLPLMRRSVGGDRGGGEGMNSGQFIRINKGECPTRGTF